MALLSPNLEISARSNHTRDSDMYISATVERVQIASLGLGFLELVVIDAKMSEPESTFGTLRRLASFLGKYDKLPT